MPVQSESSVKGTGPIRGDLVFGIERINKVVRVFFGKMFDAKIVNAQGERGGSCSVAPEAWITWVLLRERSYIFIGTHPSLRVTVVANQHYSKSYK